MAWRGDITQSRVAAATGQTATRPDRGSRTMLLANEDAARFVRPGRMTIVSSLRARPSMNPWRL
jgi:hypothetical protein